MEEYINIRTLEYTWKEVAWAIWNKFEDQKYFEQLVIDMEEGPHGLEVVKAKVAQKPSSFRFIRKMMGSDSCSLALMRYDFAGKGIGQWERVLKPVAKDHEEKEFLTYRETGPTKVEYLKRQTYLPARFLLTKMQIIDRWGFEYLMKKLKNAAKEMRAANPT